MTKKKSTKKQNTQNKANEPTPKKARRLPIDEPKTSTDKKPLKDAISTKKRSAAKAEKANAVEKKVEKVDPSAQTQRLEAVDLEQTPFVKEPLINDDLATNRQGKDDDIFAPAFDEFVAKPDDMTNVDADIPTVQVASTTDGTNAADDDKSLFVDAPRTSRKAKNTHIICAVIMVVTVLVIGMVGGALAYNMQPHTALTDNQEEAVQIEKEVAIEDVEEVEEVEIPHVHTWTPLTETLHHDAVTQEIYHPAEYETKTVSHTICNVCQAVVDNAAVEHQEATGHIGYTTNVPRQETVKVKDAWTETTVVTPAYDEQIIKGSICLDCGATTTDSAVIADTITTTTTDVTLPRADGIVEQERKEL